MPKREPRSDDRKAEQRRMGARLRAAREEGGLTQSDLADAIGYLGPSAVSAIERGMYSMDALDLFAASKRLGYPIAYFVDPEFSERAPNWPRTKLEWKLLAGGDEKLAEAHFALDRVLAPVS